MLSLEALETQARGRGAERSTGARFSSECIQSEVESMLQAGKKWTPCSPLRGEVRQMGRCRSPAVSAEESGRVKCAVKERSEW